MQFSAIYQKDAHSLPAAALQACFPDLFEYQLTDGGMHIVAFLRRGIQDAALAEVWQRHQLRVLPLSGWYMQTQKRYGLVIGYTNIRSYEQALALLQGVEGETRRAMA